MKLLVIEDDRETAAYLVKGLSESGYTVEIRLPLQSIRYRGGTNVRMDGDYRRNMGDHCDGCHRNDRRHDDEVTELIPRPASAGRFDFQSCARR